MIARTVGWKARPARDERADVLLASVPMSESTLIVELLAEHFVIAFDTFARDADPQPLLAWIGRMCEAHGDSPGVATLFASACTSLERVLPTRGDAGARQTLRTLDRAIGPIVARAHRDLAVHSERMGETDAAINGLITRLDRADPLSAEHSRAVASWCTRLARRLSLSEDETTFVTRAGLVHDVGKTTTPPEILCAPRKLTDAEFDIMRAHTTVGERLVLDDPRLVTFALTTRSHHERLDGRGYPDRLPSEEIPLAVRIVTVADSFNAMIGRRPYRPPMLPAAALDELERGRGAQFDPEVVAAMRDVVSTSHRSD